MSTGHDIDNVKMSAPLFLPSQIPWGAVCRYAPQKFDSFYLLKNSKKKKHRKFQYESVNKTIYIISIKVPARTKPLHSAL